MSTQRRRGGDRHLIRPSVSTGAPSPQGEGMCALRMSTGLPGSRPAPSGSFAKAQDDKAAAQAPHPRRRGWRPRQPAPAPPSAGGLPCGLQRQKHPEVFLGVLRHGFRCTGSGDHSAISFCRIWTALLAAPLRIWSPQHQRVRPRSSVRSSRMRPTQTRSWSEVSSGVG